MREYLKTRWQSWAMAAAMLLMAVIVLFLYDVPLEPVGYIAVLVIICETGFLIWGYRKYRKKQQNLLYIKENGALALEHMEAPEDENEALYQDICRLLDEERIKARNKSSAFGTELMDFYTMWVHQIKTPIAASRLLLQEGELNPGEIQNELFKIEQYVDMVLGYLRTQDLSSDLCLEEVNLDEIIKDQIHKFARIFVGKKLSLDYEGVEETVLTDKKWLGFVIGQILSNALKYTKKGKISIYMSKARSHTLVIEDTGIGIRQEDLPRVFEKRLYRIQWPGRGAFKPESGFILAERS